MEIKTEKITPEDLLALKNLLYINKQRQIKVTTFLFGLTACILFIPTPILSLLSRRAAPSGDTMFLFFDFGPMNVLLFMVIPLIIICVLVYFYILQIPNFKKDIETQEKEIGIVKVREIVELSERDKKELAARSYINFELLIR